MQNKPFGKSLIFLISQPRGGSTLLQRILGCHPDIYTTSEPWLMLHPLHALSVEGLQADYNSRLARNALLEFLKSIEESEETYIEAVRIAYTYIYGKGLEKSGKRYFLDKTPRYYLIIPELFRVFPEAYYIILLRNPIAVLCSMLKYFIKENWYNLYSYRYDLIKGPDLLLKGQSLLGERCTVIHYEEFVSEPEKNIRKICEKIGIEFKKDMIEYGSFSLPKWKYGDQGEVYQKSHPITDNIEKWKKDIEDPQIWRLAREYINLLGKETITKMGYSFEDMNRVLQEKHPLKLPLIFTFSFNSLVNKKSFKERKGWELHWLRFIHYIRKKISPKYPYSNKRVLCNARTHNR